MCDSGYATARKIGFLVEFEEREGRFAPAEQVIEILEQLARV